MRDPTHDPNWIKWTNLCIHINDVNLNADFGTCSWIVKPPKDNNKFRYFRIIQTGKNKYQIPTDGKDEWSDVFVAGSFEIYGKIHRKAKQKVSENSLVNKQYAYHHDGDTNGIVYALEQSAPGTLKVTTSGVDAGKAENFIERSHINCWTQNKPFSWFCVDLGANRKAFPSHYTLRYASSGTACCPRNWALQASNTGSSGSYDPLHDPNWTTLKVHTNDKSLNSDFAAKTFPLETSGQAFRYYRVLQTGKNAFDPKGGPDTWGDVLVCGGFELYGYLADSKNVAPPPNFSPQHQSTTQQPSYGASQAPPSYGGPPPQYGQQAPPSYDAPPAYTPPAYSEDLTNRFQQVNLNNSASPKSTGPSAPPPDTNTGRRL